MRKSGWTWNERKRDGDAAKWAGFKTLNEFYELSREDRIDILARYTIDWKIQAINSYEQSEEVNRKSRRGKKPRR